MNADMKAAEKPLSVGVRIAREADLDPLLDLVRHAHAESRYARLPFGKVRLHRYATQVLRDTEGKQFRVFLAEQGETPVGMLAASAAPLLFSAEINVQAQLFYVVPQARGTRAPFLLLEAVRAWAEEKGAAELSFHVTRGMDEGADRINRFFRSQGFVPSGENLHLVLK